MPDISANLSLPYLQPAQAQKHVTHNEALLRLDALVQPVVASRDLPTPPGAPLPGEAHLVPAGASGAWSGQDAAIAVWDGFSWMFLVPRPGWRTHVLAESLDVAFDGSVWAPVTIAQLPRLGLNTTADDTNRLAVAAEATLLTHDGAGHQVKINKAAASDTATLLYQTGYSGRAEIGLAGNDDWSLKVSPDGSAWTSALTVAAASGLVGGAAVQSGAEDATAGRLLRTGAGGVLGPTLALPGGDLDAALPGVWQNFAATAVNKPGPADAEGIVFTAEQGPATRIQTAHLTAPVSQANRVYTRVYQGASWGAWAAISAEREDTADGSCLRHPDGSQICWQALSGSFALDTAFLGGFRSAPQLWTFPAAFSSPPTVVACPTAASAFGAVLTAAPGPTAASIALTAVSSQGAAARSWCLQAVGRWF